MLATIVRAATGDGVSSGCPKQQMTFCAEAPIRLSGCLRRTVLPIRQEELLTSLRGPMPAALEHLPVCSPGDEIGVPDLLRAGATGWDIWNQNFVGGRDITEEDVQPSEVFGVGTEIDTIHTPQTCVRQQRPPLRVQDAGDLADPPCAYRYELCHDI